MPGTTEWYNVKYDGEDDILTLNLLLDIEKGDLNVILKYGLAICRQTY